MPRSLMWAMAVVAVVASPLAAAEVTFEAPEMILDASSFLYPSPVYEDVDNDGDRELVIGDLRGYLTVFEHDGDGSVVHWGEPAKLQVNGEDLKLPNW